MNLNKFRLVSSRADVRLLRGEFEQYGRRRRAGSGADRVLQERPPSGQKETVKRPVHLQDLSHG